MNDSVVPDGFGPTVKNFVNQVESEFLPMYVNNAEVSWDSSNALFSIFFGINDVTNSWSMDNDSLNYEVIQSYQNLVNEVGNIPYPSSAVWRQVDILASYMRLGHETSSF